VNAAGGRSPRRPRFVPVPGNVGVAEFGLTVGLTSAGMSAEAAVAAVLLDRVET
jgi:uncharacterized membrane protein YbhN (UPF0104 family)